MGLQHPESFVGVFFEGFSTPQKTLDRLLVGRTITVVIIRIIESILSAIEKAENGKDYG